MNSDISTIPNLVNRAETIPLDTELIHHIKPNLPIVSFIDLYNDYFGLNQDQSGYLASPNHYFKKGLQNLDSLYTIYGNQILIIFEQEPHIGHWGVLFRVSPYKSVFYESYGFGISKVLSLSKYTNDVCNGQNVIKMMLSNTPGMSLDENFYHHQAFDTANRKYSTCGFHALSRLKFSELTNTEYNTFITSLTGIKPDAVVCLMLIDSLRS